MLGVYNFLYNKSIRTKKNLSIVLAQNNKKTFILKI